MENQLKPFFLLVFFILSLFSMELIIKIAIKGNFFSAGTFISLLFLSIFALIFYMISRAFRPDINKWISVAFLSISGIIYASQFIYYQFFKTFYTIYSAGNAGQITEFWKEILKFSFEHFFPLVLFFLPALFLGFFGRRIFSYRKMKLKPFLISLSSMFMIYLMALLMINVSGKDDNSPYDLYYFSSSPVLSVDRLGLLTTMRLDFQRLITGWTPALKAPVAVYPEDEVSDKTPNRNDSKNPGTNNPEQEAPINKDQVMDIDFDALIEQEKDPIIKEMHNYFQSVPPTKKNEYTGMFEGYNFIFITAEGFSPFAVHKDVTPTLYKMVNEGFRFTNFYTPIWGVSTSDGEYVATTGLIPKSGVWSYYESADNYMPFAMGNQLRKLGDKTVAYHNHTYDYYRRDVSHPNMGYDYKALGNGLEITETWPESDLEMMEVTIPEYIHDEPFHAYYMTVSGHLLYNFTGNYIAYKNRDLVKDLPYSEQAKAYLATQIELDRALEHLLNELEKKGIADKTLIALSADHYPYGLDKKTIDEFAGHKVEENFELYRNTFILYTKGMESVTIDKPASSLDIIPSLSNLLGLEYDSRLLMGRDIFADEEGLVIFQNRSFITDRGRYNSITNEFIPNDGFEVDDEYIQRMSAIVNSKFYYSTMILDNDYYSKIFDKR